MLRLLHRELGIDTSMPSCRADHILPIRAQYLRQRSNVERRKFQIFHIHVPTLEFIQIICRLLFSPDILTQLLITWIQILQGTAKKPSRYNSDTKGPTMPRAWYSTIKMEYKRRAAPPAAIWGPVLGFHLHFACGKSCHCLICDN